MVTLRTKGNLGTKKHEIPPEVLNTLRQLPWCSETLDDPDFVPFQTTSRRPLYSNSYTFMAQTLSTLDTLSIWQSFYRPSNGSTDDLGEVRIIAKLGSGMNGHQNTAHGGLAAVMLDEVLGLAASIHKSPGKSVFTAYIHVDYKKPLPTPSVILIKARLELRSGGRKLFLNGTVENGSGVVFTSAHALFLEVERKKREKL